MKKPFPTLAFACLYGLFNLVSVPAIGQDKHLTNPDPQQLAFADFNDSKGTFFLSAERMNVNKANTPIEGYYRPGWLTGVVEFKNGKQYREGLLKFDLINNQLTFKAGERPNVFAEAVAGFTLLDTTGNDAVVARFNNGYPAFGKQDKNTFYQVLAYGPNAHLLKYISKYVVENQVYNGMTKFSYKQVTDYFVFNLQTNEMKLVKKTVSSLVKALPGYQKVIRLGRHQNKIEEGDMIDIIDVVNRAVKQAL